ncbi:MAG: type III pantothenate kinase [Bacteroides sp.]|nr:type III pantothenate kinase [Bacteroides sp.]
MRLLLDIGNTRLKASLADGDELRPVQDWAVYVQDAEAVLVSNVAGEKSLPVEAMMHPHCHILTWQSPEARTWLKDIPMGLGADRVAADIGARSMCPHSTLLIIDAGTCLTFDVIAADGRFLGGAISPGICLRLKAMHEHTSALPMLDARGEHPVLGYNTPTAMRSGAINGVKWEIEGYIRYVLNRYPDLQVFFTGGNRTEFPDDLRSIITCDPLLVQKGLLAAFASHAYPQREIHRMHPDGQWPMGRQMR